MKTEKILIANLKCGGCVTTIKKELLGIPGVLEVKVDVESDSVEILHENVKREMMVAKLHSLGYPEATEENGLLLQLKSYASCVIGRINNL